MSSDKLAIDGGSPIRTIPLPYGRHEVTEADVEAVAAAMRDPLLTRGPKVRAFEEAVAQKVGAKYGVAYTSGTAALDGAAFAGGLAPGKRLITPTVTFAASANMGFYHQAEVALADLDATTWNISPDDPSLVLKPAVITAVDFAGLPADVAALRKRAPETVIVRDAAHSLGAHAGGEPVGSCSVADMACFSFHPVKVVTSLEGGVVTTNDETLRDRLRRFRDHGMERDKSKMTRDDGPWYFEQQELGRNYRITDVQAALGLSQLARLDEYVARRNEHAAWYREHLPTEFLQLPPAAPEGSLHAYHLFVVLIREEALRVGRREVFEAMLAEHVGLQVHYLPLHRQPYHSAHVVDARPERFPVAEDYYARCMTLPLFPGMNARDRQDVLDALGKIFEAYKA